MLSGASCAPVGLASKLAESTRSKIGPPAPGSAGMAIWICVSEIGKTVAVSPPTVAVFTPMRSEPITVTTWPWVTGSTVGGFVRPGQLMVTVEAEAAFGCGMKV